MSPSTSGQEKGPLYAMQISICSPVTWCKDISAQRGLTSPLCFSNFLLIQMALAQETFFYPCPKKATPVCQCQVPPRGDKTELYLPRDGDSLPRRSWNPWRRWSLLLSSVGSSLLPQAHTKPSSPCFPRCLRSSAV